MVAGNFYPGTIFSLGEPFFGPANPNSTVLLGPGVLVENFRVLDPFTATADVTVSPRVLPTGHHAILDTDGGPIRMGDYTIECGDLECADLQDNNFPPTGQIDLAVSPDQTLVVNLTFADQDLDIVQSEIAVEELESEEVLLTSPFKTYSTEDGENSVALEVPELAPGEYLAIGIIHDGLDKPQVVTEPFSVTTFSFAKPTHKDGSTVETQASLCVVLWHEQTTGIIPCKP